jgi:uridine phosphorylase
MNELLDDTLLRAPQEPVCVPLIARRDHGAPSVFRPEALLRAARRQKALPGGDVPPVCVLDPDGDLVAYVRKRFGATPCPQWACYHTQMWTFAADAQRYGVIGHVVGGSFAVLVAEQLFASGCGFLINLTSAGQITDVGPPPYYILVARALRDEGTSYHYLPPADYAAAEPALLARAAAALAEIRHVHVGVHVGDTWTTDAPFRETEQSIAQRRRAGILEVEMEAASLYAFAAARERPVICLAHVSNQLGCVDGDFEKGDHNGAAGSLALVSALAAAWRRAAPARAAT